MLCRFPTFLRLQEDFICFGPFLEVFKKILSVHDSLWFELLNLKYFSLIIQCWDLKYLNRDRKYLEHHNYLIQSLLILKVLLKIRRCCIKSHQFLSLLNDHYFLILFIIIRKISVRFFLMIWIKVISSLSRFGSKMLFKLF